MSFTRRETLALAVALPILAAEVADAETPVSIDPRAPVHSHPPLNVVVQKDGVQAKGYRYASPKLRTAPEKAKWIGLGEVSVKAPVVLFRREFQLSEIPREAVASLSADISYRLWVNGKLASRGPSDIGMDYNRTPSGKWFFEVSDLTALLKRGANVLAVEVFAQPLIGWEGSRQPGHLLCELLNGEKVIIATDMEWRVRTSDHWSHREGRWSCDLEREPNGWRQSGFKGEGWSSAKEVPNSWLPLVQSEIPARMEVVYPHLEFKRISPNVSLTGGKFPISITGQGEFSVRYDRILSAFIGLRVRGGKGGTLHIEPNEPDAPGYHRAVDMLLTGAEQTVELPFLDSYSVINLRATGLQEPLEIMDVISVFASQPVAYRGAFECNDPELNRLWNVCRWSTQICLQTHHLDSPHHQEPISDPGDYMILSLNNYAAFFQPALARQDLRKYAWIMGQCKNQVFHTSYALLWLQMLMDYFDHTGDEALIRELAPAVFSLIDTFTGYLGKNGLVSESPNYMFMDWVEIAGFPGHHPPAVIGQGYLTAFYYRALEDARRVAKLVGEPKREAECVRLRLEVKESFQRELWSEGKSFYRDGKPFQTSVPPGQWLPADKEIETFTSHVNILAVLYDIAPKETRSAILERAMAIEAFTCQPYFMHFVFEAMAHAGLFQKLALNQMKRWKIVEETQSLREMWTVGDLSHGWGATPLRQLSRHVLGVSLLEPGGKRIAISPKPCGLTHAKGVVPLPMGDVKVEWFVVNDGMNLKIEIPKGCVAEVSLPGLTKTAKSGVSRYHVFYQPGFSQTST